MYRARRHLQQLPWVVEAHFSISYEGVKAFVSVRTEDVKQNYAELYAAVGNAVAAHVKHPYDDKCKILTQPCFYSWHPEVYFNGAASVFVIDKETKENGDKQTREKNESTSTESGFLTQFLDNFERRNPFIRDSRNSLALKLGRTAQSKGFSKSETEEIVQLFARKHAPLSANGGYTDYIAKMFYLHKIRQSRTRVRSVRKHREAVYQKGTFYATSY